MKKAIRILSCCLAILMSVTAQAGTPERITRILDAMPIDRQQIPASGTFSCFQLSGTTQFYTESQQDGSIAQIGAKLFSDNVRKAYDPVVISCVERIWVELLLRRTTDKQIALLKEYGVRMVLDGYPLGKGNHKDLSQALSVINSISSISMTTGGNEIDLFMRSKSGTTLHIYIPADRDLLFPFDKKEHEEFLLTELTRSRARYVQSEQNGSECYMIDSLTNDVFYSEGKPIFDKKYPVESMRNILMGAAPASALSNIKLKITPHTYNKDLSRSIINMSLSNFLGYFQQQGLKFYSAQMDRDGERYQCILVMFHPTYNYMHMFSLSFTSDQLFSGQAVTLNSDLSAFIPQHYIKNLFQEK